jgi:hypothetical protein
MATGPLSSLYVDKFSHEQLIYPSDLGTSSRKGHWVMFSISNVEKSSYYKQETPTQTASTVGSLVDTIVGAVSGFGDGIVSTFTNNDPIQGLAKEDQKFYKFLLSPPKTQLAATISLYMPDTVSISQNPQYNAASLTEALQAAGQIKSLLDSATEGNFTQAFKNIAAENIAALGNSRNGAGLLLKTQGQAVNPQMELLFTNIDFRSFQFDFLLTPKNHLEASNIYNIVQAFKFYSAPELNSNSAGGRYFVVPSIFDIQFYFEGGENGYIHKLAPAVLTAVVVDSAPQGWVTHPDGSPVQTRLTLQFTETEIMTKQKILEKGY